MAQWTGLSGANIIDDVAGPCGQNKNDADVKSTIVRYANMIQDKMFRMTDWPELRILQQSITTDGSFSYDLSDTNILAVTGSKIFGRVIDETMRNGTNPITLKDRDWIEKQDPDHNNTGSPYHYCMVGNYLILYPYGSGYTVTFDILELPEAITSTIAATAISFAPRNHDIILEGTLWLAFRRWGKADWKAQGSFFNANVKDAAKKSGGVRVRPDVTIPQAY